MLIYEVVFINDILRDYTEGDLVMFMLHHRVVEVKFPDVYHEVLGTWGQYHAVPMKFGGCEVGFWVEYWSFKCKFVSSQCESHSRHLFLLVKNVADDADIYDLGALGDFLPVNGKNVNFRYVP